MRQIFIPTGIVDVVATRELLSEMTGTTPGQRRRKFRLLAFSTNRVVHFGS
jgi:hypothetical protein